MWSQLANAINLRSSQDQVLWSIFGTFWAANAILLVALFTGGDFPTNSVIGVIVGMVGMLLSFIWHTIQNRALGHLARHEHVMATIEGKLGVNSEFAVSAEINQQAYDKYVHKGLRARTVMRASSIVGIVSWLAVTIVFLLKLFK